MNNELIAILDRIANGQFTDADIEALRQLLVSGDGEKVKAQIAKYNVDIGEGKDIHIGDRNYYHFNGISQQELAQMAKEFIDSTTHLNQYEADKALKLRNYRMVIAINFGIEELGYAYQFFDEMDMNEPCFRNKWPDANNFYPKTLTAILFRPDGNVEAWGHTARKRFTQLREEASERGYIFIDNLKTLPYEGKDWDQDSLFIMREGKKLSVLQLIAEFLKLVKEIALKDISETIGGEGLLDENEIRWCLTVPAVWKYSKHMMRRAAQMSGLIGKGAEEIEQLLLVLEPEAAALYCHKVMMQKKGAALQSGTVIMIVDAGEDKVDITVYKMIVEQGLDELVPCGGGLHGSKYIDKNFREFLACTLSAESMDEFQNQWPVEYAKLMSETWENLKRSYDATPNWIASIELPRRLEKILESSFPEILDQLANVQGGDNTIIRLTNQNMEAIFSPVLDQLIRKVKNQFIALNDRQCDILFLIGKLAESPLLKMRIIEEFSSRVERIVIPDQPTAAVLFGAAAFGYIPTRFRTKSSGLHQKNL